MNSKPDHSPRVTPGDSHVLTVRGIGISPNFLCPGGRGFELEFYSSETKLRELFGLFKRNRRQLEKQVFLGCLISSFARTVDVYCLFINIDHFGPFFFILITFPGHPGVIFSNARSLKF